VTAVTATPKRRAGTHPANATASKANHRRLSEDERDLRARRRNDARLQKHRRRILDAVALCFAERGYHETSVDRVVQRARTSKSAFYAVFANKEQAFAALLDREGERLLHAVEQAIVDEPDDRRKARQAIATFVTDCAANRTTARILLVESVGMSPAIEETRRALHARFAEMILAQARARLLAKVTLDLEVIAYALVGAVNEAVVRLLETGRSDPQPVVDALDHLAARALQP